MMKIKSHALLSVLTLVTMACSESGYTPANTQPGQMQPGGMVPGYQPNLANGVPMMPNRQAPTFIAPGLQMNAHAGFQFNWQTSPYYYLKNPSANCSLRRQVDYTSDRCACYQAPCNCESVMRQVSARCPYTPLATTTTVVKTVTTRRSRGSCSVSTPCSTVRSEVTPNNAAPVSTENPSVAAPSAIASTVAVPAETTSGIDSINPVTPALNLPPVSDKSVYPVSIQNPTTAVSTTPSNLDEAAGLVLFSTHGADAKALYERLAKKADEEKDSSGKKTNVIRGQNYKCTMAKVSFLTSKEKKEKAYNCDFDIGSTLGLVKMQSSVSADGPRILKDSANVDGETVKVGGRGLQPDEGMILIKGTQANLFYDALNTEAKLGLMNSDSSIQANVKILGHLKCSRTLDAEPKSECQIKISTGNGAVLDAS